MIIGLRDESKNISIITVWTWLHQALDKDKSCKNAVSRIVSCLAAHTPPSTNTGAYCKARKRIKETLILRLLRHTGQQLHQQIHEQDHMLWHDAMASTSCLRSRWFYRNCS